MQAIVDEARCITIDYPASRNDNPNPRMLSIRFGRLTLQTRIVQDQDGELLTPHIARLRNMTYAADLFCDIEVQDYYYNPNTPSKARIEDAAPPFSARKHIGQIPIMLRSNYCMLKDKSPAQLNELKECVYDQGGYFIVNGSEKVIIGQERAAANQVLVNEGAKGLTALVMSMPHGSTGVPNRFEILQVNAPKDLGVPGFVYVCRIPKINDDIPIGVLFRALGYTSDLDIIRRIAYTTDDEEMLEALRPSLLHAADWQNVDVALDWISKSTEYVSKRQHLVRSHRIQAASEILARQFLPHVGTEIGSEQNKAFYLGYMCNKLISTSLKRRHCDDRDHFGNKRVNLTGALMATLFRQLFYRLSIQTGKEITKQIRSRSKIFNPHLALNCISDELITDGIKYALATGNWTSDKSKPTESTGVAQELNRLTFSSSLSHLRRSTTTAGKEGKSAKIRQLHNTQWGYVCPAETPEGQACGIVKNLSLLCLITVGSERDLSVTAGSLEITGFDFLDLPAIPLSTKVIVDGTWLGITSDPSGLVQQLKDLRRHGTISWDTTIYWSIEDKEIRLYSDPGRLIRPLYIVKDNGQTLAMTKDLCKKITIQQDNRARIHFADLVNDAVIEYLDTLEEDTSMIAMTSNDVYNNPQLIRYTHCEIHPCMVLGVCASIVPFPDHNQSPRNTYQSAMGKQAMGVYTTNFNMRFDTLAHVFYYPQKPLVASNNVDYIHFKELPAGTMAIVAIGCYTGYNQEDSVIMNQSAIDRGIYRSMYFKLFASQCAAPVEGTHTQRFMRPTRANTACMTDDTAYQGLDADGFIAPGSLISGAQVVIGKVIDIPPSERALQTAMEAAGNAPTGRRAISVTQVYKDMSEKTKVTDSGVVDAVMLTTDPNGNTIVKMRVRSPRIPTIGDKFASRHGQKGTCGMTYRQEDMPFTKDGVAPDIIINPHAIPSRMTIGHLFECLVGKVSTITGQDGRATPFLDVSVEDTASLLFSNGYPRYGNEMLYSGFTGRLMPHPIFFGPTFYQRLKHLVDDKIHARARGKVTSLTRQPTEGRANDGGLRMGEMERDCFIAHGVANMLRDRLFKSSDYFTTHVCERCGMIASANTSGSQSVFSCKACDGAAVACIEIPYACKLLFQELMAMSIVPRMFVNPAPAKSNKAPTPSPLTTTVI